MKLHDLKPAPGSRKAKRRVGRGIAAGQGKTAGRGTKGQKARAGGSIPAWFEGGQTPLHQRIPKLRGFKNPFKVQYEVVNLGDIARLVEAGELEAGDMPGSKGARKGTAPITVNQEILRAAGLVRRLDRPMKVLGGGGDLSAALFVVADAFSANARSKIEGAGGTVSVLEVPDAKRAALGIDAEPEAAGEPVADAANDAEAESEAEPAEAKPSKAAGAPKASAKPAKAVAATKPAATKPEAAKATAAKPAAKPAAKTPAARKPRATKPDADA
ncbi:MAG TPA: 50S ribosomal protein L15 [Candidatus Dormibacteraeota bacterium]|nr:50S ribosomal protein L15 [Candidatus Dormibacteraeota bacterium]